MNTNTATYKPSMEIFYGGIKTFASFYKPENNWDNFSEYTSDIVWVAATTIDNIWKQLGMCDRLSEINEVKVYLDEPEEFCESVQAILDRHITALTVAFPFNVTVSKMINN